MTRLVLAFLLGAAVGGFAIVSLVRRPWGVQRRWCWPRKHQFITTFECDDVDYTVGEVTSEGFIQIRSCVRCPLEEAFFIAPRVRVSLDLEWAKRFLATDSAPCDA